MTEEKIGLYGDGIHDDTAAIQTLLDEGRSCVYLPPPAKHYRISRTLLIHSNQELRLDRYTLVRLAPESDCLMAANADFEDGNVNVALTGGIWDYDNLNQYPNAAQLPNVKPENLPARPLPAFEKGQFLMHFSNVSGLCVRGIVLRDPAMFALTLSKVENFTIDDIEFDFKHWNPVKANLDGVHLNGSCRFGRIGNLRGTCYDDLLALNAPEGAYPGPITDIDIDGIYADYCHSAIRLLSYGEPVKRIAIRNIHGRFYRYAVGITHFVNDQPDPGIFDDITIENCFIAKAEQPDDLWPMVPMAPILIEAFCEIGNLYLGNLHREEDALALPFIAYNVDSDRAVAVDSHIRHLTIENCTMTNHLAEELEFFRSEGPIGVLTMRNNQLVSAPGAGACVLRAGKGKAQREFISEE